MQQTPQTLGWELLYDPAGPAVCPPGRVAVSVPLPLSHLRAALRAAAAHGGGFTPLCQAPSVSERLLLPQQPQGRVSGMQARTGFLFKVMHPSPEIFLTRKAISRASDSKNFAQALPSACSTPTSPC